MSHAFLKSVALCGFCLALSAGGAMAACYKVKAEVVSLGEEVTKSYAERNITREIEDEKETLEATGKTVSKVVGPAYECKPYPNLIGADEWTCTGTAKVCSK